MNQVTSENVRMARRVGVRARGLVIAAGLVISGVAASVVSAAPAILDRMPTDAPIVVASKPLNAVEQRVQALGAAVEAPVPIPTLAAMLEGKGLSDGVDMTKPVGVAMYPVMDENGEITDWNSVQLVATTDYGALLGNFDVQPGGGVDEVNANGETVFLKQVGGGYAAVSTDRDLLTGFGGEGGSMRAFETRLGETCGAMADDSDIVVVMDVASIRGPLKAMVSQQMDQMARQAAMMGQDQAANMAMGQWVSGMFLDQSEAAVATVTFTERGIEAEFGMRFAEGSRLAGVFNGVGEGESLLNRLPMLDQGFLAAFAMDTSSEKVRGLLKEMGEQAAAGAGEKMPNMFMPDVDGMEGSASVVGASPSALFGGGFLVNTVTYVRSSDPAKLRRALQTQTESVDGMEVAGATMASTYTPNATEVNGASVDEWTLKIQSTDPNMAQAMMMMYGPSGPGGYLAETDTGVVMSMSRNSQVLGRAMEASEGRGATLGQNDQVKRMLAELPGHRVAEALLGVQGILDTVKPMLGMMGAQNVQLPSNVPPMAMSVASGKHAARMTMYVPADAIKAGVKLSGAFAGMGGPGGPGGPAGGNGTGQPMF